MIPSSTITNLLLHFFAVLKQLKRKGINLRLLLQQQYLLYSVTYCVWVLYPSIYPPPPIQQEKVTTNKILSYNHIKLRQKSSWMKNSRQTGRNTLKLTLTQSYTVSLQACAYPIAGWTLYSTLFILFSLSFFAWIEKQVAVKVLLLLNSYVHKISFLLLHSTKVRAIFWTSWRRTGGYDYDDDDDDGQVISSYRCISLLLKEKTVVYHTIHI